MQRLTNQRVSTQRRDISQHREAVLTKARAEVEREWTAKQAAAAQDAAESRAVVIAHREREQLLAELREERAASHPADSDSGGSNTTMAKKKTATKTTSKRDPITYPSGKASYWHFHQIGPTHEGVAKGEELQTTCGKTLGLKYWRAMPGRKVDCAKCLGVVPGKAKPIDTATARKMKFTPVPKPSAKKARGTTVKNYSGKAKVAAKRATKAINKVLDGMGIGEPTPTPAQSRKRSF